MKRLLVVCGILLFNQLLPFVAHSQLLQPRRYEIERKQSDNNFSVISLKAQGLALLRETNKYEKGNQFWELIIIDTALQEKSNQKIEVDTRNHFIGFDYVNNNLSLLFRKDNNEKGDLTLVTCHVATFEIKQYTINPEIALRLTHFNQAGEAFVLGGYVASEPALLLFNPIDGSMQIIPGFFQKDSELVDVRTNENQTFNVVLIDRSTRSDRKLTFRTFDTKGTLLLEDVVAIEDNFILQTGMVSTLQREDIVMMGTWGNKNSKQSAGFFSLPIDPFNDQKIKYVALGELEHYLDYLRPKRAKRIIDKTKEDLKAGKVPSYANHIIPYKIVEHSQGFILLADVYNPSNSFNQNPTYAPYNPYAGYYDPFLGYYPSRRIYNPPYSTGNNVRNNEDAVKTYETVIIAVDGAGKLKWDESLKLEDIKLPAPEQVTDFSISNDRLHFIYKKESELKAKIISLGDNEVEELTEKIKLKDDSDEIRSEDKLDGGLRHWYENAFYVWGYQSIKNKSKQENTNRQVFYINKVVAY